MDRTYNYQCKDRSVLTRYLRQYLAAPLMPLVPVAMPANFITIISNIFVYISLILTLWFPDPPPWVFIVTAIMLLTYVVGDHMDGMQAKKTQTSSPLGEFCDHFLDTFNNGLILLILVNLFNIENQSLIIYLLSMSYLAHAAVFFHQFKTGWLVFEKFGSLEAMALTIGLIGLSFFSEFYNFLTMNLYGFTLVELMLIFSSVGALGTLVKSLVDARGMSARFIMFVVLWLGLASFQVFSGHGSLAAAVLILYASTYIGSLMYGHLVDGKEPFPDVLMLVFLALMMFTPWASSVPLFLLWFLIIRAGYLTVFTVYALRQHWVWSNPLPK